MDGFVIDDRPIPRTHRLAADGSIVPIGVVSSTTGALAPSAPLTVSTPTILTPTAPPSPYEREAARLAAERAAQVRDDVERYRLAGSMPERAPAPSAGDLEAAAFLIAARGFADPDEASGEARYSTEPSRREEREIDALFASLPPFRRVGE
jgi:hypothetical protein